MNRNIVAIIPARGGSKRIKNKNLLSILNKPLIDYTLDQANKSKFLKDFFVSSDDELILDYVRSKNFKVIKRPKSISKDTSSSESVLKFSSDYIEKHYFNIDDIMMLQCTSPIRKTKDIDKAIDMYINEKGDSLVSVIQNTRFFWEFENNIMKSINYDYKKRPRSQELRFQYMETGSIYITNKNLLNKTSNRLGGKIIPFIMDFITNFEIDTIDDVEIVEWALTKYYDN